MAQEILAVTATLSRALTRPTLTELDVAEQGRTGSSSVVMGT